MSTMDRPTISEMPPVHDAPAGANNTVTTLEDTAYPLKTADFAFIDSNENPANALNSAWGRLIVVLDLPAAALHDRQRVQPLLAVPDRERYVRGRQAHGTS